MKSNEALNARHAAAFARLGIKIPDILFPRKDIKLADWSVVACDQYTSDHKYWQDVAAAAAGKPSTLHLTLPEIYLEAPDVNDRIEQILGNMKTYLADGLLEDLPPGLIYLERQTAASGLRQGLVFAMDLEKYDFAPDSQTLIRATEGTIVERIPPRLRVRSRADLELPHIMILIDDPARKLIEGLAALKSRLTALYDVTLMKHGGQLSAWLIQDESLLDDLVGHLEQLLEAAKTRQGTQSPLFFAMGDGNHSLATARAHWLQLKEKLRQTGVPETDIMSHPARYALAEIVNIHSPGLRFEPIHRAIFTPDMPGLAGFIKAHPSVKTCTKVTEAALQNHLAALEGQMSAGYYDGLDYYRIEFTPDTRSLPPAAVDALFNDYRKVLPAARIDFIHGWQDTARLSAEGAIGVFVPVIAREKLFAQVQAHGPLPRKAFSMGDAEEKKYYMECRRITR